MLLVQVRYLIYLINPITLLKLGRLNHLLISTKDDQLTSKISIFCEQFIHCYSISQLDNSFKATQLDKMGWLQTLNLDSHLATISRMLFIVFLAKLLSTGVACDPGWITGCSTLIIQTSAPSCMTLNQRSKIFCYLNESRLKSISYFSNCRPQSGH